MGLGGVYVGRGSILRLFTVRSLALTTTYRRVTSRSDPIRCAIRPDAQHPVVDCWMVNLVNSSYTLPRRIESVKPNLVFVFQSVVVNVEFPDSWDDVFGGAHKILGGRRGIPRSKGRRPAGKLALLFDGDNGRGSESCILQRMWNDGRVRRCRRRRWSSRVGG